LGKKDDPMDKMTISRRLGKGILDKERGQKALKFGNK